MTNFSETSLNIINLPVIVSDMHDVVLFKNNCAKKTIKMPTIGSSIIKYINKESLKAYEKVKTCGELEIISININSEYKKSLVVLYKRFDESCIIYLFSSYFDTKELGDIFLSHIEKKNI